jgi:predicted NUDIX family NTP pyrophosphohydrolase
MPRTSAGLLLYRGPRDALEVLLVHPGGPLWARRDDGAWSIPKGELDDGADPVATAAREFREELGEHPPLEGWAALGEVRQSGGKRVLAWAVRGDLDVQRIVSNTFEIEWPPHSGRRATFPEVDRAEWFGPEDAMRKLVTAQGAFVERLVAMAAEGLA